MVDKLSLGRRLVISARELAILALAAACVLALMYADVRAPRTSESPSEAPAADSPGAPAPASASARNGEAAKVSA
jgi:hypothetical protein